MSVTVRYFAIVREAIGKEEEVLDPPADVETVAQFLAWLSGRGEEYEAILRHGRAIRVALDKEHEDDRNAAIAGVREIALFPPMTGG
jgi:molybdopterin synthase sulfur carrier subunit